MNDSLHHKREPIRNGKAIGVWFNPADEAIAKAGAKELGMTFGKFVNRQVRRKAIIIHRSDPQLCTAVNRVGVNLNQIARWANGYKEDADAREVISALLSIERTLTGIIQ